MPSARRTVKIVTPRHTRFVSMILWFASDTCGFHVHHDRFGVDFFQPQKSYTFPSLLQFVAKLELVPISIQLGIVRLIVREAIS